MVFSLKFIGLLFLNLIGFSLYSVVDPYLPVLAESKGVTSTYVGLIFCCNPIAAVLTSMYLSTHMSTIGKEKLLLTLIYSILPITSYSSFMIISFSMRSLQGVVSGCINTVTLAIVATT